MLDSTPPLNMVSKISLSVQNSAKSEVKSDATPINTDPTNSENINFKDVIKEVLQEENKKSPDNSATDIRNEATSDEILEEQELNYSIPATLIPVNTNEVIKLESGNYFPALNIAATIVSPSANANSITKLSNDIESTLDPVIETTDQDFNNTTNSLTIPKLKIEKSPVENPLSSSEPKSANNQEVDIKLPNLKINDPKISDLNTTKENYLTGTAVSNPTASNSSTLTSAVLNPIISDSTESDIEVSIAKETTLPLSTKIENIKTSEKVKDIKVKDKVENELKREAISSVLTSADSEMVDLKIPETEVVTPKISAIKTTAIPHNTSNVLSSETNISTNQNFEINNPQQIADPASLISNEIPLLDPNNKSLDLLDENKDLEDTELDMDLLNTAVSPKKSVDPILTSINSVQNINFLDKKALNNFDEIMSETDSIKNVKEEKNDSYIHTSSTTGLAQRQDMKILQQSVQDMSSNPTFQKWLESVEHQLSHSMKNGLKEIDIQIEPPHLGKLKIHFSIDGETTNLQMTVYNPAAKETMDQHLQKLRDQMQDLGYRNSNVELSLAQQDQRSSYQQQQSFDAHSAQQQLHDAEMQDDLALPDLNNSITKSVNLVDLFV